MGLVRGVQQRAHEAEQDEEDDDAQPGDGEPVAQEAPDGEPDAGGGLGRGLGRAGQFGRLEDGAHALPAFTRGSMIRWTMSASRVPTTVAIAMTRTQPSRTG